MGILDIFNIFFPKRCAGCSYVGEYICLNCTKNILQTDLICPQCQKPSIEGRVHPLCFKPNGLDGLWFLGVYQGSLKKIIQNLKYKWVRELAQILVDLLIKYWAYQTPAFFEEIKKNKENWVVTGVPLHRLRENWRGFNQSKLLGSLIAQSLGLDYQESLIRTRYTKPQVKLSAQDRRKNIFQAFETISLPSSTINHPSSTQNYLLVDDVWTTGSTLKECCYTLKKSGAQKIWAITLAK